jgi:hypothetical protein
MKMGLVALVRKHGRKGTRLARIAACLLLGALSAQAFCQEDSAQSLASRYQALRPQLDANALGIPLRIESLEQEGRIQGEVYAVLERPFAELQSRITVPQQWCPGAAFCA